MTGTSNRLVELVTGTAYKLLVELLKYWFNLVTIGRTYKPECFDDSYSV